MGEVAAHGGDVGFEFGLFGDDYGVNVADRPAVLLDELMDLGKEFEAIGSGPLGIRGGEVVADVAKAEGTEEGIHDGVGEYVCVAMAEESEGVGDGDSAEDEGSIGAEAVDVVAVADAEGGHGVGWGLECFVNVKIF